MKILRCLGIGILVVGTLLSYLPKASAESSTITATIFIRVLEKPNEKFEQPPDLQECVDSQLQKNPQSVPEIKVEKLEEKTQSENIQVIRYTICEKV